MNPLSGQLKSPLLYRGQFGSRLVEVFILADEALAFPVPDVDNQWSDQSLFQSESQKIPS
jgi:hypothetical protein